MNHRTPIIAAVLFGALTNSAVADRGDDNDSRRGWQRHGHHHHHHEHGYIRPEIVYAPVVYVEPVYQVVQRLRPRRECWSTTDAYRSESNGAAGLVLGGVIGQNLGDGRDAAVIAGTLLGATIGHDLDHSGASAPVTRTHCRTANDYDEMEQIIGYRVQYRYLGRVYETRTDRHPGSRVRVTVNIDG